MCLLWMSDWRVLVLSLMLLLFFIVTSVVIVLICRVKAWTMKNNPAKTPVRGPYRTKIHLRKLREELRSLVVV